MTVKDLTEKYLEGTIVIVDKATSEQACICNAQAKILDVIADKTVDSWQSVKSSNPKIQVSVDFS